MISIIAALPCLGWAASTPSLTLTGQQMAIGNGATLAPFVSYQSLGQTGNNAERGLQLYGATSNLSLGESDSLNWTGGFFVSKSYQTRTADDSAATLPLDISRLDRTATWFREPGGDSAGGANLSGTRVYRQLVGEDRMSFQRLSLTSGSLSVSGEYLDVGAKFQGAGNLAGQLPNGLDAKAVEAARGMENLKLGAELQAGSSVRLTTNLSRFSNLQPGHKQYGTSKQDLTTRLDATLGGDTKMSLVAQSLQESLKGETTETKTRTLSLAHSFGQGRTLSLTDSSAAQSEAGTDTRSHTRVMDLAWAFDPRLKLAAKLTDADTNGVSQHVRDLRLSWSANGTAIGLRQLAASGAEAKTATTLDVATHLLGGALKLSRHAVSLNGADQVTRGLEFEGKYGKTHLKLNQISRSGVADKPDTTLDIRLTSALDLGGTPVALNAVYGQGLVNKNNVVSNPGAVLRLVADEPGFNLIADLRQGDTGSLGSRFYVVQDPKETSRLGPWGDLLLATLSANEMNRASYEHALQLGGLRLSMGQRMVHRAEGGDSPAVFTSFDLSRQDLPEWASTLRGAMFAGDANYKFIAVPAVARMKGKTGLRLGVSRLAPGGGGGFIQTLDYAALLGGNLLAHVYLGRAGGGLAAGTPERSQLLELSSRYQGKLTWVLRLAGDRANGVDSASQGFGLRGHLSQHETLALTLLRSSAGTLDNSAFALDYSRHLSDDHYLSMKAQCGSGANGSDYRMDLAYQRSW